MINKNNITQTVYNALFNRINRRLLIMLATIICLLSVVGTVYLMMQELPAVSVVVRRVDVNGKIQTSIRQMNAENVTINSNGAITGGLYIPGTPNVRLNGRPIFGGVVQGTGNPQPTNHQVTLNSNATLGKLFNRIDPVALPTVAEPPATSGTRDVNINNANDQIGDFATIRDLTINGNVSPVVVPVGTYRNFTANNGGFILGVSGATQPSVYNFNKLTLNGNAQLQVLGPVIVTLKETVIFNGSVGNSSNSNLLTLKVSNGSVTLNSNASFNGTVIAPTGTVTVNGNCTLKGVVIADKLTVNGNGVVNGPTTAINAPSLSIQQPVNNTITQNNTVRVTGTVVSDFAPIVKINGAETALNGNSFSADVTLAEGSNTINVTATDFFSNQATATVTVIKDTTTPILTINQPNEGAFVNTQQVLVTGTVSDFTTTQVTVNDVVATISNGQYTATVPVNNEGINTLTVKATDFVSNQATLTRNIIKDTTPPLLTVTQPQENDTFTNDEIIVTGSFTDANSVTVIVNGIAATISANDFTATVPLNNGANTITIIATDTAGNQSQVIRNVVKNGGDIIPPDLNVVNPIEGTITSSILRVSGTITDDSPVILSVNDFAFPISSGSFDFNLSNITESPLKIIATDSSGNKTTVIRNVIFDTASPIISNVNLVDGMNIPASSFSISGNVTDTSPVNLTINDLPANISPDGTFTFASFQILEGDNTIVIKATDAAGNTTYTDFSVIGNDITPPFIPIIHDVISPTRLNFQTIQGWVESGSEVVVTGGAEPAVARSSFGSGFFTVNVLLINGNNNLNFVAKDAMGNTSPARNISITSDLSLQIPPNGQPAQINVASGNSQHGLPAMQLPRPLIAIVTDKSGSPISGIDVTFKVVEGQGRFSNNNDTIIVTTDIQGHASTQYTVGNSLGLQLIQANFISNTTLPAAFVIETLETRSDNVTMVSGVVLDQNLRALPNVLIRIGGQQTRTSLDGQFEIMNISAGPHQLLEIIGRDQVALPGRWPNISYDIDILPSVNNNLGRPIFLPKVNDGIELALDGSNTVTQDTTYELPIVGGLPPIKVTAKAGTHITFPPDTIDRRFSVTRIANNRVPMLLEDGLTTNLYISVQPSGAIFEPPLEVSFPNLDQLPANAEVSLMSFDHDAGKYVKVGIGRVTSDGLTVTNQPGSGIRIGAWHGFPPPPCPQARITGFIQIKGTELEQVPIISAHAWVDGESAALITPRQSIDKADRLDYIATLTVCPCNSGSGTIVQNILPQVTNSSCNNKLMEFIVQKAPIVQIGRVERGAPNQADADRLPDSLSPTKSANIAVTFPEKLVGKKVFFEISDPNPQNGAAVFLIDTLSKNGNLLITGQAQTSPGHNGNLKIQGTLLDALKKRPCGISPGFSVCAHPSETEKTLFFGNSAGTTGVIGTIQVITCKSDSGSGADLTETRIIEKIKAVPPPKPPFCIPQDGIGVVQEIPASGLELSGGIKDVVAIRTEILCTPYVLDAAIEFHQLVVFECRRCKAGIDQNNPNVVRITIPRSGYNNTYKITKLPGIPPFLMVPITKAQAITVGENTSSGGIIRASNGELTGDRVVLPNSPLCSSKDCANQ